MRLFICIAAEFQRHIKTLEVELEAIKDGGTLERFEVLPSYLVSENIDFVAASKSLAIRFVFVLNFRVT